MCKWLSEVFLFMPTVNKIVNSELITGDTNVTNKKLLMIRDWINDSKE